MANNFSRALAIAATDTINMLPAWEFMNQTGTLGTNLRGSLIQVGTAGNINVIPNGKTGLVDTVTVLTQLTSGSGYYVGAAIGTTRTSIVPTSVGPKVSSGLTVSIDIGNVPVPDTSATALGTGYTGTAGAPVAFTTTGGTAGSSGLIGIITSVNGTGGIIGFTITRGGQGYAVNDVLTFVSGDGINGTMTLSSAPNGAVTGADIAAGGEGYAIGDIITIDQAGSGKNATFRVDMVRGLAPVVSDGVLFTGLQAGDVLPIYVDYVLVGAGANATTAGALVAGRESSIS